MTSAQPLRILLVEDQAPVRATLRQILLALGHEVWEAVHGVEALDYLQERLPDIILTDMDMPVMNGEAMCEALASHPDWSGVPLVLMTGHDYPGLERARALLPHAQWIGKPFTLDQLRECLGRTGAA